jgi:hypothetical protein
MYMDNSAGNITALDTQHLKTKRNGNLLESVFHNKVGLLQAATSEKRHEGRGKSKKIATHK